MLLYFLVVLLKRDRMKLILFFVISCLALHNGKGKSTVYNYYYKILCDCYADAGRGRLHMDAFLKDRS